MPTKEEVFEALKYHVEVDVYDTRRYYNSAGELHREDGPAIEWPNGSKEWWQNGKRHREDGPAYERPDGTKEWWYNNLRHCTTGPAVIYASGYKCWFLNGVEYTESNYPTKLAALGLADDK